jgi:hypothetical protein
MLLYSYTSFQLISFSEYRLMGCRSPLTDLERYMDGSETSMWEWLICELEFYLSGLSSQNNLAVKLLVDIPSFIQ